MPTTMIQISQSTQEALTTLRAVSVENEFLGLSLTQKRGFEMRRVCIEIHSVADMVSLRDFLNEVIAAIEAARTAPEAGEDPAHVST